MSELDKITEVFPHAKDNELIVSLTEALSKAKDKRVMAQSESGQQLSKELWGKSLDLILNIRASYITTPEHELRAMCAALDTQMGLYEELTEAGFLEDMAKKELDDAVKDLDSG